MAEVSPSLEPRNCSCSPVELNLGSRAGMLDYVGTSTALSSSGSTALLGAPDRVVGSGAEGAGEVLSVPSRAAGRRSSGGRGA